MKKKNDISLIRMYMYIYYLPKNILPINDYNLNRGSRSIKKISYLSIGVSTNFV